MTPSGVLVLDKPTGMTSHDVVARVRRRLGTRKVGHAGTLDPDATGVLVLCIGNATRLLEYIVADHKVYHGSVVFGVSTDTDDASGAIVAATSAEHLDSSDVVAALATFVGTTSQRVPAYSAVHVDGVRAYKLARRGQHVDTPMRQVTIERATLISFTSGLEAVADFEVACSKGTYIRALCRDWGAVLGVPAHMGRLRRIQSGQFHISQALPLEEWEQHAHPEQALLPEGWAVQSLKRVQLDTGDLGMLSKGKRIRSGLTMTCEPVAVFSDAGTLAAIVVTESHDGAVWLQPKKVFWKKEE